MQNKHALTYTPKPLDNTDVTTWELPDGAIARFGRGQIGSMAFSPDGTHLAVPTRIGCWLYDLDNMTHRTLWGTERGEVPASIPGKPTSFLNHPLIFTFSFYSSSTC